MKKLFILFIALSIGCASAQPKYTPEQLQLKQFREAVLLRGELPPELQNLAQLTPEQYRTEREKLWKRLEVKRYDYIRYRDWPGTVRIMDFMDNLDTRYCHAKGGKVFGKERLSCEDTLREDGWIISKNRGMGVCRTPDKILFVRGSDMEGEYDNPIPLYITDEEIHQWLIKRLSQEFVGKYKLASIIHRLKGQPDMSYIPLYDEVSQKAGERTTEGLLQQAMVQRRVVVGRAIKLNAYEYLLSVDDPRAGINLFHVVLCPPGYHVRRGNIGWDLDSIATFLSAGYTHSDIAQYLKLNEISAHFGVSLMEAYFIEDQGDFNLNGFALRIFMYLQKNIWFAKYNFLGGKDVRILSPDTIQVQGALTERQLALIRYILGPSQFDQVKGSGPWLIDATFRIPQEKYGKPELLALSVKELIR